MVNYCGLIGTVISLVGVVLITISSLTSRFVDVYLVQFADDVDSSTPVAGVGIFESFYDSGRVDDAIIAAAGVPVDTFVEPTLVFRLLFPSQENFVTDLLPINEELVTSIAAAVGDPQVEAFLSSLIQGVEAVEFDTCETYVDESKTALLTLFGGLQDGVLPGAVDLVSQTLVDQFNENLALLPALSSSIYAVNPIAAIISGIVQSLALACDLAFDDVMNATDQECFVGFLSVTAGVASSQNEIGSFLLLTTLSNVYDLPTCDGVTVQECLETNYDPGFPTDTENAGVVSFDSTFNICTATGGCDENTMLNIFASFLADLGGDAGLQLAGIFGIILGGRTFSPNFLNGTTLDEFEYVVAPATLPTTFDEFFQPCNLYRVLEEGIFQIIPSINLTCSFGNYFDGAIDLASEDEENAPLVGILGQVVELYDVCQSARTDLAECPELFGEGLLAGALAGGTETGENFTVTAVQACANDVIDNEKIGQGQQILYGAYVFYGFALILPAVALFTGGSAVLFGLGSVASGLAGALTFGALFVVRSAPVYDGVGIEPNEDFDGEPEDAPFETFFVQGPIAVVVISTFFMMAINGVVLLIAAIMEVMSSGPKDEEDEFEIKDKQVDIASPNAAADPEEGEKVVVTDVAEGKDVSI